MDPIRINGLAELISAAESQSYPPVEAWNPPYCGDIGLHITEDGQWHYQGSAIRRVAMVKLFSRVLRCDEDGRHYLVTPVEKVDVKVDDAPFLAVEMEVRGEGREQSLLFRTNLDDVVQCGSDRPLRFRTHHEGQVAKPYVLVRGRLQALVSRALYYDLVEIAIAQQSFAADEASAIGIWSSGSFFAVQG